MPDVRQTCDLGFTSKEVCVQNHARGRVRRDRVWDEKDTARAPSSGTWEGGERMRRRQERSPEGDQRALGEPWGHGVR